MASVSNNGIKLSRIATLRFGVAAPLYPKTTLRNAANLYRALDFMSTKTEVIKFVAEFTGTKIENINMETTINYDLGVDGDDGTEFISEFSERFGVDVSNIKKLYFGPEGFEPITAIIFGSWGFFSGLLGRKETYSKLTVSQLVSSVGHRVWVE